MRRNNVFPASQGLIQLNFRPKTFQVGIASNKCAFTNPYFSLEAKNQFQEENLRRKMNCICIIQNTHVRFSHLFIVLYISARTGRGNPNSKLAI